MRNIVIDSTVFVSTLGEPDVFSNNSKQFFKYLLSVSDVSIVIPTLVVAETVNIVQKQNRPTSHLLSYFSAFTIISLDHEFLQHFVSLAKRSTLKTSDTIIAVVANMQKAVLITWDKQLLASSNTLCKALTPKQYIHDCSQKGEDRLSG